MSNVFAREHKPTGKEYYDLALRLRTRVYLFVMNEKNVPLRHRRYHADPVIAQLVRLRRGIVDGQTIYPTNAAELQQKRDAIQQAINACENIIQALQETVVTFYVDVEKMVDISNMLIQESALLRKWKKNAAIPQKKEGDTTAPKPAER